MFISPATIARNRRMLMSHLLAGTPEELREAARQLGLSAHVPRPGTAKEHLDLSESKLREGLRMGAVEVTGRQLAEIIRSKRSPGRHGTLTVDAGDQWLSGQTSSITTTVGMIDSPPDRMRPVRTG